MASVPPWMGRLPFPPEDKRATVITPDMEISTIYGEDPHRIRVKAFVSTDKITLTDFAVLPGDCFAPPGFHGGHEFYYLLQGTATAANPATGKTHQIREGETFLISKGTWHQVFNFGDEEVVILSVVAPILYPKDGMGSELKYVEDPRFYVPGEQTIRWPVEEESASRSQGMIHTKPDEFLPLICGKKNHILASVFFADELMQVGMLTVPSHGYSDSEAHFGDEVLYILDGKITVEAEDKARGAGVSALSLEAGETEKILIPEGVKHRYYNFCNKTVRAIFAVAPN